MDGSEDFCAVSGFYLLSCLLVIPLMMMNADDWYRWEKHPLWIKLKPVQRS